VDDAALDVAATGGVRDSPSPAYGRHDPVQRGVRDQHRGASAAQTAAFLGSQTGLNNNKLESSGLETFSGQRIDAPLLEGCLAWIECGLRDVIAVGDHTLFVGEVVRVQALDEAYAGNWLLESPEFSPLTYIGGTTYAVVGSPKRLLSRWTSPGSSSWETAEEREERRSGAQERELREEEVTRASRRCRGVRVGSPRGSPYKRRGRHGRCRRARCRAR
jgi:hypothetical protein